MSVRGEFRRILGDTTSALRVCGALELAEQLERAGAGSDDDLAAAALRVLALIEGPGSATSEAHADSTNHLAKISRVVVGR